MYPDVDKFMRLLPPEYPEDLLPFIREEFLRTKKTLVILDDDPTGTQTCYDVTVLTSWRIELLVEELNQCPSILFILTNTRSMPEHTAVTLTKEIGQNLKKAVQESGRDIVVISRSDSTLRGHFPAEVDAIATALDMPGAVRVIVPAFIEGGRFTIDDVHYVREQNQLIPVADTAFAKDTAFGYTHSNLRKWIEEKTKGRVQASSVISISLEEIRRQGPEAVCKKLVACATGDVCIVNAGSFKDLEVLVMGLLLAERSGKKFLYRTSATFVPLRAGISPGKILLPENKSYSSSYGSLVVVGSYVPKTTAQLEYLLSRGRHRSIEIEVTDILHASDTSAYIGSVISKMNEWLASGEDVVIYTSRVLQGGSDPESSLQINKVVSSCLVSIVSALKVSPSFIVAKGGITSSDLATKGLGAEKARILGQVIAGVPVWTLDKRSKLPEMIFVVFPGNVGDDHALFDVWEKLSIKLKAEN